jgi:hypothetical protein
MYILTDSEDEWIVTAKEPGLVNELISMIFESVEDEKASNQPLETID